eukprot:Nk52_evm5s243 gene=Nk52_evmTU5s243
MSSNECATLKLYSQLSITEAVPVLEDEKEKYLKNEKAFLGFFYQNFVHVEPEVKDRFNEEYLGSTLKVEECDEEVIPTVIIAYHSSDNRDIQVIGGLMLEYELISGKLSLHYITRSIAEDKLLLQKVIGLCISYAETGIRYSRVSKRIRQKVDRDNNDINASLLISEKIEREYPDSFTELGLEFMNEKMDGANCVYTLASSNLFPRASSLEILCSASTAESESLPMLDSELVCAEEDLESEFDESEH